LFRHRFIYKHTEKLDENNCTGHDWLLDGTKQIDNVKKITLCDDYFRVFALGSLF